MKILSEYEKGYCESEFSKYSQSPTVLAKDGDFQKSHNYFFFSSGFRDGLKLKERKIESLKEEIKRLEGLLVSK
jgi:hypothetical protein